MKRKVNQAELEAKHLDFPLSLKSLSEEGIFAGYASVFNVVDSHNDVIIRGAFQRNLQEGPDIKLLWQHKADEPIGIITQLREDARGLYVEGKLLLEVARAREAHALMKSGALEGMSIGYTVRNYEIDDQSGVRILKDIDLWEISLVTFPANSAAQVTHVKGALPNTTREFESFLRDAGYSRKQAKFIAAHGFDRENQWEAGHELDELINALDMVSSVIASNS